MIPATDMQFDSSLAPITVVIVTYNSAHCIPVLARDLATFPNVMVSDNASNDNTVEAVRRHLPQATILAHTSNLGFGAANNRALDLVQTRFAFLLNPDCQITAQAANLMLDVFSIYPQAAVVAPQLIDARGAVEINYRWPSIFWAPHSGAADAICCVGHVCGAAMMIQRDVGGDVARFDEGFFLYYEDDDLCLRLLLAKKNILLAPHVKLVHLSRGSVRGKQPLQAEYGRGYHHAQSKSLFMRKHSSADKATRLHRRTLALACLSLPLRLLLPVPKHVARHWGRIRGLLAML